MVSIFDTDGFRLLKSTLEVLPATWPPLLGGVSCSAPSTPAASAWIAASPAPVSWRTASVAWSSPPVAATS